MNVKKVDNLNFDTFYKVLNSSSISDLQKTNFILENRTAIKHIITSEINEIEFKQIMDKRTIQKFRPLKNSYTKWGDKLLLSKALNIPISEVPKYVKNVMLMLNDINKMKKIPPSTLEILKTYVYRHGNKDELIAFFDYELKKSDNIEKTLKTALQYAPNTLANYFVRPIHRMTNKVFVKLYNTINYHIQLQKTSGVLTPIESKILSKWALIQLYIIQSNSKLINSIKTYKNIK